MALLTRQNKRPATPPRPVGLLTSRLSGVTTPCEPLGAQRLMSYIPFPPLSPEIFAVDLFGFHLALRWYALAYIVGLVAGWKLIARALRSPRLWPSAPPMTEVQLENLFTWVIAGVILGGRLG
jgi:Prolipoprotein diacylglyceryl transferase